MLLLYNKAYAIFTKRLFSDLKDFHKLIYGMFSMEHFSENKKKAVHKLLYNATRAS